MLPSASTISRRLLGRLRDVMAGGGSAQDRLDKVVTLIAADMVAEVCSCYVMRAGEVLELFATEGLLKSAVHETRLRVGEGLVGDIAAHARPLALADAQSHPRFAYRPETGEEIFHSLVGVPIIRGGRVIGVLVVQNKSQRQYTEEEVETLETVAMVLAELVSSGELINRDELAPIDGNAVLPVRMEGVRLTAGIGIGVAVMHEPKIIVQKLVAEDPQVELARLRDALNRMRNSLDEMFEAQDLAFGGEHREVLETYRMFAEDAGWRARISEAIQSGLTAEAAVQKVHEDTRIRMSQVSDPYLRERLHDLEDIANRLLQHLVRAGGSGGTAAGTELPENTILVCRTMGPTELLDYDRRRLRGLVLEDGSPTMHVAILARALDIPVVGRVKDALVRIDTMDPVVVDGDNGQVFVRPSDDILDAFAANLETRAVKLATYAAMRDLPAVTQCDQPVRLLLNAGLLADVPQLEATGAHGIGLYRTEMPFMARPQLPDVWAQTSLYSKILDAAQGKPVVFRTLDVGSDKLLPYWDSAGEDNPAMGWRSIRITLDRPAVLRHQLRALVRAGAERDLYIMFPMVAEAAELIKARALLDMELERHRAEGGKPPAQLRVGTMLEVPSLAWQLPALLKHVDFISIGSNDLTQFLFAADRGNMRISERYDVLSPPMLSYLRSITDRCLDAGVQLSLCGEMAGRPLDAMVLLGLGIRNLSMSAPSIGPVKAMVRSLSLSRLEDYMSTLYDLPDHSVRDKLRNFALDHGVQL
ncbi:phosphoenolpyruvate--protein phosphotransferase [Telmatospirillum siberiense]|uniref:phosphoenolpyruvate--protein phosphotransferase n=1 Tax=Telmatospirillum siberiense TaxID=382514 RepID=A0A2N3Q0Z8_9PROT|nr:phosphoenolpyruvate--protein phosphotransferase [Telmatospirillum siberiense]PKU26323.1 phosphoenolpyruvate--protein phosphotransferase [Telmatospirillum siberiense]